MPLWLRKRTSSKDLYKAKIIILFRKSENKCTSAGFANWTAQTMRVDGLQAVRSDAKALMFSFPWGLQLPCASFGCIFIRLVPRKHSICFFGCANKILGSAYKMQKNDFSVRRPTVIAHNSKGFALLASVQVGWSRPPRSLPREGSTYHLSVLARRFAQGEQN